MNGNQTIKRFHGHFKEGFNQVAVRPCFGNTCLPPIFRVEGCDPSGQSDIITGTCI